MKFVNYINTAFILFCVSYSGIFTAYGNNTINNASEKDFYEFLRQQCRDSVLKNLSVNFSDGWDNIIYDSSEAFSGLNKTLFFKTYKRGKLNFQTDVTISNLQLKNFKKIIFYIQNYSHITFNNCVFTNVNNIHFFYGPEIQLYFGSFSTSITFLNCRFVENDLSDYNGYVFMERDNYDTSLSSVIDSVVIENNVFELHDSRNTPDSDRTAIMIQRKDSNCNFKNLTITGNYIKFDVKNCRSQGICIQNPSVPSFQDMDLNKNKNIYITNNILFTNSANPNHGIFVQGPYKNVEVSGNSVDGFGLVIMPPNSFVIDGAIHIYGARSSGHSGDIDSVRVISNELKNIRGGGIKLSGSKYGILDSNIVHLDSLPSLVYHQHLDIIQDVYCLEIQTGNWTNANMQSSDILVQNNKLYCNLIPGSIGIIIKFTKNFKIQNNFISNPTASGICYYSSINAAQQFLGNSLIENNTIDFGNQFFKDLHSYFFLSNNESLCAGISFNRQGFVSYKNEILYVRNNNIINNNNISLYKFFDNTNSKINR